MFQVHSYFRQCNPNNAATCTCAVAVQSGDDVFVIDRCGEVPGGPNSAPITITPYITGGELTAGTLIYRYDGGTKYRVSSKY